MKTKSILLLASVLLGFQFVSVVFAQNPAPASTSASTQPPAPNPGQSGLTLEERDKLKAAWQKAMLDPKVMDARENQKAAGEVFLNARRQALLAQDSSLGPILDKVESMMKQKPGASNKQAFAGLAGRGGKLREALASLSPEERDKLKAANKKISDNPEVMAARDKKNEADTIFFKAWDEAMLAADPSIEPLLEKVEGFRARQTRSFESVKPV